MAQFKYRAKESPQKIREGLIEAPHREAAIRRIEEMGFFPIKVEETAGRQQVSGSRKTAARAVRPYEVIVFSRQLATLIKSGIPILKGLGILAEQTEHFAFQAIIKQIHSDLKEGLNFSSALSKYPAIFSQFYITMIQAGEDSGRLDEILFRLADYRARQQEIISKVRLALIYPVIMGLVGAGTIVFMFTFVMPRLMNIFNDLGENLPLPTKMLLGITSYISDWGWVILLVFFGVVLLVRFELRRKEGKKFFSLIALRLPVIRDLVLKKEIALLSTTLELLIRSGIPILRAIELTAPTINNTVLRGYFLQGLEELKQGASFGATLKRFKVFPAFMTNLISVGEESGKLDIPLAELARSYERDTEDSIKAFTSVLEPLMIVGMALIIGFIVVAMLLPIFEINLMVN